MKKKLSYFPPITAKTAYACTLAWLVFLTLAWGDAPLPELLSGAFANLFHEDPMWNALLDERIPRLIVLLCSGAALAVSGLVTQVLFQNPLATPWVLGITSGGSLAVIPLFLSGYHIVFPYAIPIAAITGSMLSLLLVFSLYKKSGTFGIDHLILIGVAVSALLLAFKGTVLYMLRDHWLLMQTISEWEAGSSLDKNWIHVHLQLPVTLLGLYLAWHYRREMNILALGDEEALNLGVDVRRVRWRLFLAVALLIGGSFAGIGIISFFGLIVPIIVRKVHSFSSSCLVTYCAMGGAASLAGMDLLLRVLNWYMLTLGNLSALAGGVFFLWLILQRKRYA